MKFLRFITTRLATPLFALVAALSLGSVAQAAPVPGTVSYSPNGQLVDGLLPISTSYQLTITSPSTYPTDGTSSAISFRLVPGLLPPGVTAAMAQNFVTFSPSSVSFTGPNQRQTVTVNINITTLIAGSYGYQVYTQGWPSTITVGDFGTSIDASVSLATDPNGGAGKPPVVEIASPLDGQVFNYPTGTVFPVQIPLTYDVTAPVGSPISSTEADLGGNLLAVAVTGLGTVDVDGSASMTIPGPGTYTVNARGSNAYGSSSDTATFTVQIGAPTPPVVNIVNPVDGSTITTAAGSLPLSVPFNFTASSTGPNRAPITSVSAEFMGTVVTLSNIQGLGTYDVTASGTLIVSGPGAYTVTAHATNVAGTADDVNIFNVKVTAGPPVIVINTPAPNSTYTYRDGDAALQVPYTFTATSQYGGLSTLTATVSNRTVWSETFTTNRPMTVTRTVYLPYTAAARETLVATTTDDYGTAKANSNFIVNVISPCPTIDITTPCDNQIFDIPSGQTKTNVAFRFVSSVNNGFVISSVSAFLGTDSAPITTTTGLGTSYAVSTGTLLNLAAGTYTLTAKAVSGSITVTDTVTFKVRSTNVPPSVVINTPPVGSTYSRTSTGPALTIPLTFTGTSNTTGGVITKLTASLDGVALTVTPTNLNTKVANGAATMTVTGAGTHTISVTAIDAYGTASATRTFTVCIVTPKNVCGRVFFDVNYNGVFDVGCYGDDDDWGRSCRDGYSWDNCRGYRTDCNSDRGSCHDVSDRYSRRDSDDYTAEDFGLANVTVKLLNASNRAVIATTVTNSNGEYCFGNVNPGSYIVSAVGPSGMDATTQKERSIDVDTRNVSVRDIGFGLEFRTIQGYCAGGKSSTFWKTQIDKACAGDTKNVTISATKCSTYTRTIGSLCLSTFDGISMKTASSCIGTKSTYAKDLLNKELCAAEYNYANGCYINNDRNLTYCFIQWGERVSQNSRYSDTYRKFAKSWFEAYNNSNGGRVCGPNP